VPVALAAVFAAGMMWIAWPSLLRLPSTLFTSGAAPQVSPPPASGETPFDLSGSARVTAPGQFRIGDTAVTLAAITALDTGQRCQRVSGSDWPCGREARQATEKLVRGRKVGCTFQGSGDPRPATCTAGGKDLAAELTRQGHSFADGLLFASYSVQEQQARETKSGLWAGTPERPDEWRARLWSEAEAAAPGGCAIKTRISGNDRRYLRPEDGDYARTVVRDARGEKWFCTEDEAKAAGFSRRED
jgi:endonuclease YncB( thermonuclease family)